MKYRKRPVIIDAWHILDLLAAADEDWGALPGPVKAAYEQGGWVFCPTELHIPTPAGAMIGKAGEMLVMGVAGEFYPCTPEIFQNTYERVEHPNG